MLTLATVALPARGREDPPRGAELVDALTCRLARLLIADEVVERVMVVGHLELAVLALRGAEEGRAHAAPGDRLRSRGERRPQGGAGAVAGARHALVGWEVVQRPTLAIDQDLAEAGVGNGDRRAGRFRAGRADRAVGARGDCCDQ